MEIKLRAFKESDKRYLEGYAALFNTQSRLLNEDKKIFREVIRSNAFDDILDSDNLNVIANVDHDMQKMLGRNVSGTLTLSTDSRGLKYIIEVPDTSLGNDIYAQVERGDYYESSFAFGTLSKDIEWDRDKSDGVLLRYVNKVSILRDVAIVRNGAYKNTDVSVRSDKLEYLGELIRNVQSSGFALSQRSTSDILIEETEEEVIEDTIVVDTTEEEVIEDTTEETDETETDDNTTEDESDEDESDEVEVDEEVEEAETTADAEVEDAEKEERSWEAENKQKFLEIKTILR